MAMLAFALMPTLSRAMAFADGSGNWAEVCTPQGMKLVSMADRGASEGAPAQATVELEHCAFCAVTGDGAAPLSAAVLPALLPLTSAEPPRLFLHAPRTLFAWRSAQPRAPPFQA